MKTILLPVVLITSVTIGQTPIISHKSHSGTSASFFIDPNSNFGQIREDWNHQPVTPFKVREIEVKSLPEQTIFIDTFKVNDSLQLINYRNKNQQIMRQDTLKEVVPVVTPQNPTPGRKQKSSVPPFSEKRYERKHSFWLFLFGITFGGLAIIRLFTPGFFRHQEA